MHLSMKKIIIIYKRLQKVYEKICSMENRKSLWHTFLFVHHKKTMLHFILCVYVVVNVGL